ncbi:MAG: hypothetical protein ACK4MF_01680 [Hyphomicrobiaceae bacterium]
MTLKFKTAALGALLLTSTAPAFAGGDYVYDYGGGSIKDVGAAGVPVPAPVPLPMYDAEWYVRMDAGYAFSASGDVEVTGIPLPVTSLDDQNGTASFSFGFGRYLTPSLRADFTIDLRNGRTVTKQEGPVSISAFTPGDSITVNYLDNGVPAQATLQTNMETIYQGDVAQRARVETDTAFLNLYYDLQTGTRFKPYIGGGVGVAQHYLKSTAIGELRCQSVSQHALYDPVSGQGPFSTHGIACPADAEPQNVSMTKSSTAYGLALNAQAGIAAEIYPGIILDTGYKMTWTSGTVALLAPVPGGTSLIDIGDRIDHEIRTGLRFNIN